MKKIEIEILIKVIVNEAKPNNKLQQQLWSYTMKKKTVTLNGNYLYT